MRCRLRLLAALFLSGNSGITNFGIAVFFVGFLSLYLVLLTIKHALRLSQKTLDGKSMPV